MEGEDGLLSSSLFNFLFFGFNFLLSCQNSKHHIPNYLNCTDDIKGEKHLTQLQRLDVPFVEPKD